MTNNVNDGSKIDFSNREDLKLIERELVTPGERWNEAKEEMLGHGMEYVNGQEHMLSVLKKLIELKLPFEEHMKQLTGFVEERSDFVQHAWKNDPLKDF